MNNELDYQNFISAVHKKFEKVIGLKELQELLSLEEDYNKDSPASVGKSLLITEIFFRGIKADRKQFEYSRKLQHGVNVWIADNGKGKSTLFKVIKYAITGTNSIKKDVKNWIHEILVEFEISDTKYVIHIDKSSRISNGDLYATSLDHYRRLLESGKIDGTEIRMFHFQGDESLQTQMQSFFFNHFSYYTLKYAQKSSKRDDLGLITASLSWSTYFKAIYLESSDHGNLYFSQEKYHDQGKKILGMLLGLKLTYPINRLTLLMHKQEEELGKLKIAVTSKAQNNDKLKAHLDSELIDLQKKMKDLGSSNANIRNTHTLIEERTRINKDIQENYTEQQRQWSTLKELEEKIKKKQELIDNYVHDKNVVENEIKQSSKRAHALRVAQDSLSFFTNLEIRICPNCDTPVTQEKIALEAHDHNCRLCGTVPQVEAPYESSLEQQIQEIESQTISYAEKKEFLDARIAIEMEDRQNIQNQLSAHNKLMSTAANVNDKKRRLLEIERDLAEIDRQTIEIQKVPQLRDDLMQQIAVITYRLEELKKEPLTNAKADADSIMQKKDIFGFAIEVLKQHRQKLNEELLNKLKGLILKEIQAFGLKNVSHADINENFDLLFVQNGEQMQFDELNESERLRAKLAFYLSLIQLDIEYQLGRHTRFLIIDSPGNEELSQVNLAGLSDIFKEIGRRFGNQLQIFIGTALREFEDVASPDKIQLLAAEETLF